MTEPRLCHVPCLDSRGLHRMAYWEWGDPANDTVLVCVHGLTRQGRDFDTLARTLLDRYRVVCPDVVGRGRSDWLRDPMGYVLPQYASDMVALLARLNAPPRPANVQTLLQVLTPPIVDTARYDRLRDIQEVNHGDA